jgi:hypothetical protein
MPSAALATWQEPVGGARQVSDIGSQPAAASIGGVPYVAWSEVHGARSQVFVARLNASGTAWEKVGGPVNFDLTESATNPSLTAVGDVPYVAFVEKGGVRVARLNAANHWEEPWRGVDATHGGINEDAAHNVGSPTLASVDGVPYVAWDENNGTVDVVRVARLDTSTHPFATWAEPWTGVSATAGGIEQVPNHDGVSPAVASINSTPYVAWRESNGAGKYQVRVARLNPGNGTWEEPWSGVSATSGGINDPTHDAFVVTEARPSLTSINNFPYVAWTDSDGVHAAAARVARLDTSTVPAPTWKQEATGVSATDGRINQSPSNDAFGVSLTSVNAAPFGVGVPYIAWDEHTNGVFVLRVARFNSATHGWEQAWPGVTQTFGAIGETQATSEREPSIVSVGGVPYLARDIYIQNGATSSTGGIRISRLEPDFTSQSAAPSAGGESFTVTAQTYGIPYPLGFQYGPALDAQTTAQPAPAGSDTVTVTRAVGRLSPATTYEYRPFATAGVPAPLVFGPTLTFLTDASGTGAASGSGSAGSTTLATVQRLRISPTAFRPAPTGPSVGVARRAAYGTVVTYNLDRAGSVRFTVARPQAGRRGAHGVCLAPTKRNKTARTCTRLVTLRGGFTVSGRAGANSFRFTGRLNGTRLTPGRFLLNAMPISGTLKGRTMSAAFRIIR